MSRIWNFSAGPATLPEAVLDIAQAELLDYRGAGASIIEMSHRGKVFTEVIETAEADLRALLAIPPNYKVLFLQGGATLQFAQIPMNLLQGRSADYVVTGAWSQKAYAEAKKHGTVRLAGSTESEGGFTRFPRLSELDLDPKAAYLHLCTNETIHGVEMFDDGGFPSGAPLVADMSSHILSRPLDIARYGLIYAGAQKNVGPSGLTLVIVREDLIGHAAPNTPGVLDYQAQAANGSMLNTPSTFAIYMAGLVFQWLKQQGGLAAMEAENRAKAALMYEAIAASDGFYKNHVAPENRSRMNIPFFTASPELDTAFVKASEAAGFMGLKGHKSVGGIRASIYNAMPRAGVLALVDFMREFAAKNRR